MATQVSILAWRIPCIEEPGGLQSWGGKESDTTERLILSFSYCAYTCINNSIRANTPSSISLN